MKFVSIILTGILSLFVLSAGAVEQVIKKPTEISSFGVRLGQPTHSLNITSITPDYVFINPKEPAFQFFSSYKVVPTPEYKVYKVMAVSERPTGKFSCFEAAAFLDSEFSAKYDTNVLKRISAKDGEYIYMSDDVSVGIICMGEQLSYSYMYRKDLDTFPVPSNKFKNVESHL